MRDVTDVRREVADEISDTMDIGYQVVDASGWEREVPGLEMTRPVFVENEQDPTGPSLQGTLVVRFDDAETAKPSEAYFVLGDERVEIPVDRIDMPDAARGPTP